MSAQSDEEDNGNDENIPTNSIVEQDDNLYAVTEYAQPRAVRGIGDISTNTNPQDPVPLSIPDETALNNSRQQNNPDKEIPAKSPSGNLAVNNQQTTNAKEKQENIPANQSATPNNPASPQITTDEKNVLASHTENVSPQITDVANKANSQKITSQENTKPSQNQAPSHTPTSTTNQKPAQPATSAQTTNTVQKPAEPVKAQTTDISQKPQKPVVAQTTNTTQKPAGPAVVAQTTNTTNTTQKPVEPVVAQTTNTTQKPTEPAVVAQTTNTTQKPAEPAVVAQTTNTTQKPVEPAVVAQTTDANRQQPKQKHSEERQQAATLHPGFSELPEVTAPPQGAILEGKPIFKVQIAATTEPKNINSDFFHGFQNVDAYTENGMVKYTIGATDNFAEVESLRNTLVDKFPGAFIIAFRDGYKIPLQSALREYRRQQ